MKTLKHLALCLAAAFIATGCSNDENEPKTGTVKEGKPVKFEMNIGNANTRTVTTGSGSNRSVSWREGDAVGIFVYESTGAPTEYTNIKMVNGKLLVLTTLLFCRKTGNIRSMPTILIPHL